MSSTVAYQFTVEDRFLACDGKLGSCSHLPEAETIRRSFSSMSGAFAFNYDNNDDDYRSTYGHRNDKIMRQQTLTMA